MPQLRGLIFDLEGTLLDSGFVRARLYPGAIETLAAFRVKGIKTGVCTNRPSVSALRLLQETNLAPLFDFVGGSDTFEAFKPDPRHVAGVAHALKVPAAQCAMIGDGANDIEAARAAHICAIAIAHAGRGHADRLGADAVVEGFDQLGNILQKLGFVF